MPGGDVVRAFFVKLFEFVGSGHLRGEHGVLPAAVTICACSGNAWPADESDVFATVQYQVLRHVRNAGAPIYVHPGGEGIVHIR